MSFPRNSDQIRCNGFSRAILPILIRAIKNAQVNWLEDTCKILLNIASGQFVFKDCVWEIIEIDEVVIKITLIEGIPNQDLTAAVLRG